MPEACWDQYKGNISLNIQNVLHPVGLVLTSSSESDALLEESELDEEEEDEDNLTKHNKKWSLWDAAFFLPNK